MRDRRIGVCQNFVLPPKYCGCSTSTCVFECQVDMRQLKVTKSNAQSSGVLQYFKKVCLKTAFFVFIFSVTFGVSVNLDVMYYDAVKALKHLKTLGWFDGDDFCQKTLNFSELSITFKNHLTGQDNVLEDFKSVIEESNQNVVSVALVGGTGVGKTTFTRLFQNIFPWKSNIHFYVWENHLSHGKNLAIVRKWTKQLAKCGQNLMVIEGLSPVALNYILDFDRLLHLNFASYKTIAIYVFRIIRMTDSDRANYQATKKAFENLGSIKTIYFRDLNDSDVRNCIDLECKLRNITLTEEDIAEVSQMIKVERAGCKNVLSKIMLIANKS